MAYSLEIEESCKKALEKAGARNQEFKKLLEKVSSKKRRIPLVYDKKAIENKIKQILEDPYRFKPLHFPLQNTRRVHILKSFVMVFEIVESKKTVRILDIDHHNNVYK